MAVTQQLARVSAGELVEVHPLPDWLERILSFEAGAPGDYLDLDWAGPPLLRVCEHLDPGSAALDAVRRALDGEVQIGIGEYEPVMALSATAVADVVRGLRVVDVRALQAALADDLADASGLIGSGFDGDPGEYLAGHFSALRDFYEGAALRGLAVVVWWD
ncbi:DUF1877 family protein [Nonomuraea sp. NPDC050556]|uniref:DUF1877 family protein n=1 Tax=Nonomuraea sp. NPDC050556 TaxID=3364369 RepID=UPI0037BA2199